METWLLIDTPNLACRSWHALRNMDSDRADSMLFGVFRDMVSLQRNFSTDLLAFAFDSDSSKRLAKLPEYKSSRKEKVQQMTENDQQQENERHRAIRRLRQTYLPNLGMPVLYADGYEADDMLAAVALDERNAGRDLIIVSTDKDLYQLLGANVRIWSPGMGPSNPGRWVTRKSFTAEYGVPPSRWAEVKAIAGCSTDDVPGIDGVGEKKAIQYLLGTMPTHHKTYAAIQGGTAVIDRNRPLVQLPLAGCPALPLRTYAFPGKKWDALMDHLNYPSLSTSGGLPGAVLPGM